MKTLKVTELATYEFEVPDDFPVTVERAEEFFCSLEHPRGDANQLTVLERYFDLEDADGNEIEMGIKEAVDIPVGRYGHTPSEPCSVNAS
jgi:hypothetical protein